LLSLKIIGYIGAIMARKPKDDELDLGINPTDWFAIVFGLIAVAGIIGFFGLMVWLFGARV
jgi:hypothetical protein